MFIDLVAPIPVSWNFALLPNDGSSFDRILRRPARIINMKNKKQRHVFVSCIPFPQNSIPLLSLGITSH